MPTTTQITDILFKKYFGLGDTQSGRKFYEEPLTGRPFISPSQIWTDAQSIPYTAPGITTGVVALISGYKLTQVVGTSNSFTGSLFNQVIPFDWGDGVSYNYTIKDSLGNSIPFGTNDWIVDTDAGILMFNSGVPTNIPPTISFYRYSGHIGLSSFITTGQTGSFGSINTGQLTGLFYPLNSNPAGYVTTSAGGSDIQVTGSSILGTGNFSGIGGANVILSGNFVLISGGASNISTYNQSGAYIFNWTATSGVFQEFINFPTNLGNSPYVITSINNLSGIQEMVVWASGITSSGYWAQYSDIIDSNNYIVTTLASLSTSTGLATTVIIQNTIEGGITTGNYVPISGGQAIVTGSIVIGSNAGIYTFQKTIAPNVSPNICYLSSYYGTHTFNLGVTVAQSGFCVGKMFSVVSPYSGNPVVNMTTNSGPYNNNDFQVNLSVSGNSGVLLNITNNGSISGTFTSTIFLCGMSNNVSVIQY